MTPEQYISKSAVVTEIEKRKHKNLLNEGAFEEDIDILYFLNTLEVKEMDLDEEYAEEVYSHLDSIKDTVNRMTSGNFMHNKAAIKFSANTIAKVLELMGLKAQKGK